MIPQSSGFASPGEPGHEIGDVRIFGVVVFLVVLIVAVIVFQAGLGGMMAYFSNQEKELAVLRPDLFDDEAGQYAGPELQDSPNRDRPEIMRAWYSQLGTYGWTDPSNKVARIPIDRAMSLLAERGIEKVPPNPLPYDVGQPEDMDEAKAESAETNRRSQTAPARTDSKPEASDETKPRAEESKSRTEPKDEEPKATPAPDPKAKLDENE